MSFLTCSVRGCRYRHNRRLPKNISLYMLPRDAPDELKIQWKQVCTGRLVACSEHFTDSDFLRRKTSPESNGKFKPLRQNVVPKISLPAKKIVPEAPGEGSSKQQEKRKYEEIIILNDSPEKDSAQMVDPLADDIVQEVQEHKNIVNAIECRISEPPKKNLLNDTICDEVFLKEDAKRISIERGPIKVRLEDRSSATLSATVIPTPGVLVEVVPGKPPPKKSTDGEKKAPKVVLREVKLARKKFGDALARQKASTNKSIDIIEFLQRKDLTVKKRGREDEPENFTKSVKHPKIGDLMTSSYKSPNQIPEHSVNGNESSVNVMKSSDFESMRKGRRKQIFHPGRDKLIIVSKKDCKAPSEVRKKPEQPSDKLPKTTEDDDDVIFLPQKIDVIDVEDDSDTEKPNQPTRSSKCDLNKCKYKSKISASNEKIISLLALKEKLKTQQTLLQTTNQKIFTRHTATQDFLELVPTVLSETQKDIIFGTSDPVVWQSDEIRNALVLKNLSEDLYMFLRQVLNYPLPTLESLKGWEKDFPEESIRARNYALEYEQQAEDDMMEDEENDEAENMMLLSQVSVEIKEENQKKPLSNSS